MVTTTVGETTFFDVLGGKLTRDERVLIEIRADAETPAKVQRDVTPSNVLLEPINVGRASGCHVVLNDPLVSAVHFELTPTVRGLHVRDRSKNGTFIDGHRCGEQWLRKAAEIRCGDTVLHYVPSVVTTHVKTAPIHPLVGTSIAMGRVYELIRKVASKELDALITGETGTGKELVARAIHLASARAKRPFVVIDCSAVPASLAESTFFGHKRGAFTGADYERISPFLDADGGTVFLDEIGELSPEIQPKLLRVLQERRVQAVGSNESRRVDVRVLAATHRDLNVFVADHDEIGAKRTFRSDLYFRFAQVRVVIPPLRDRTDDIPQLIAHFASAIDPRAMGRISDEALEELEAYNWPGNVRELRNVVVAAFGLADDDEPINFEPHLASTPILGRQLDRWEDVERRYIERLFRECRGNQSEMARIAGVPRPTIRNWLKRHGLLPN